MATEVSVKITGPSRDAVLSWQGASKALSHAEGKYSCRFDVLPGKYTYSIVVFGAPGEKWKALVTTDDLEREHSGHMSPAGVDTTGDTGLEIKD